MAMIELLSDVVKAMRHRDAITSQKVTVGRCRGDSVVASSEAFSIESLGDDIMDVRRGGSQ